MEAIILAGGQGTRLQSVVRDVPKPMAPVGGRPFLAHLLDYWIQQGVTRIVISVGYKANVITSFFAGSYRGVEIAFVQETQTLGTGGGVLLAENELRTDGPFLLLNGDTFFKINLKDLLSFHQEKSSAFTLALKKVEDASRYSGILLNDHAEIERFDVPASTLGGPIWVNAGVYLIERPFLKKLPWKAGAVVSFEKEIIPELLRSKESLYGFQSDSPFIDIGIPEDYRRCEEVLRS